MLERLVVLIVRIAALLAARESCRACATARAYSGRMPLSVQRRRWTALERESATLQLKEAVQRFRTRGRFPLIEEEVPVRACRARARPPRGLPFPTDSPEGEAMAEDVLCHSLR